jgi:hypothetical protein
MLSAEEKVLQAYDDFHDHRLFAEETLSIHDKDGRVIPYRLAPSQRKFYESIARQEAAGKPVRQVWLKARQVFASTLVAGYFFQKLAFHPGRHARIIAHEVTAAGDIFDYYKGFDASYRPFRGLMAKSKRTRDASNELRWANESWARILTAANVKTARSARVTLFHASEMAFWDNAATLWRGMIGSCPDSPDSAIICESTANGVGNEFCDLWETASAGDPVWEAVFFPWFEHPEYQRSFESDAERGRFGQSLDQRERELHERYDITLENLHWRRFKLRELRNDLDGFRQEYPSTPEEAFLVSGRPRFSIADLAAMPVVREPERGRLEERRVGPRTMLSFLPEETEQRAPLTVFRRPQPGHAYVIGADTAQGIDVTQGRSSANPDYSAACVLDVDSGDQVAQFRERLEPSEFAAQLEVLGMYYNWAFIIPEINGNAIGTVQKLLESDYPSGNIYQRAPNAYDEIDGRAGRSVNRYGWLTTVVSRPQLLALLDDAIRSRAITVRDPTTLMECRTFVIKPSGKAEAEAGKHDDCVIALALALIGIRSFPDHLRAGSRTKPVKYGQPQDEQSFRRRPPQL